MVRAHIFASEPPEFSRVAPFVFVSGVYLISRWRNQVPREVHFQGGEIRHPGKCIFRVANSGIQETWPSNIFSDPSEMGAGKKVLHQRPPIPCLVAKLKMCRL